MVELLVLALAAVVVVLVAALLRWTLLRFGGATLPLFLRLRPEASSGGWVAGLGRYRDDELQWFRVFSLAVRPRRTLRRPELRVDSRRAPQGAERRALHTGEVVLCCRSERGPVELAMEAAAVTGFLAWLEAGPPGVT
ncbi:MAG TPA: DUF2550 domain-containing protein [Mycobacteriales bacterium]|nr:DUF2550 domain-containing protein [Mycobacteriales bacterium]